jgi:glyoxylate reductase
VAGYHGLLSLLTQRVGERVFAAAEDLEIVANCAVGVDNIDLGAAERRGVVVTHTPDVLTDDTADLAWALILAVSRGVVSGDAIMRRGEYDGWQPGFIVGRSLSGRRLGVIGAGRIGRAVLARAPGFGVETRYYQRHRLPIDTEKDLHTEWCSLDELLATADIVSLHASLNERNRHLLNAEGLAAMKPGSLVINTARGPLIDEAALAEALQTGHLGGAGLDVYEHEPRVHPRLLELENVVLLPHIGSATWETRVRMADCCFEDLITMLADGRVPARALVGTVG